MAQTTYTLTLHYIKSGKSVVVNQGRVPHTRKWLLDQLESGKLYDTRQCGKFKYMGRTACKTLYVTSMSKHAKKEFYYSLLINERINESKCK